MLGRFSPLVCCFLLASCTASQSNTASTESGPSSAIDLSLNDVSVLMPYIEVPELLAEAPSIDGKAPGSNESYIPKGVLAELDRRMIEDSKERNRQLDAHASDHDFFLTTASNEEFETKFFQTFGTFDLASIRFDPCANAIPMKTNGGACKPQLRIVWQILNTRDDHGKLQLAEFDANIHTIYTLSQAEWQELLKGLVALHQAAGFDYTSEPLGPHPVIKKEGVGSPFLKGLMTLVGRYARASKLTQVAALANTAPMFEGHWPMQAFEVKNGTIVDGFVPLTQYKIQRISGAQGTLGFPSPLVSITDQYLIPRDAPEKTLQERYDATRRVENPRMHDVSNTDCGSCHMTRESQRGLDFEKEMAAGGGNGAGGTVTALTGPFTEPRDLYKSQKWNLARSPEFNEDNTSLQMFSFFNSHYAVSQRTINESAEVLDMISASQKH